MRAAPTVAALALVVAIVCGTSVARAGDWTDTDCSRWLGTPQYATCVNAQRAHSFDCERWTRGEREWEKCQHAKATREEVECYKARTVAARNECRAQLVGALEATRRHPMLRQRAAMRTARPMRAFVEPEGQPMQEAREVPAPRGNAPVRTGPLSWSNIRPAP